LLFFGQLTAKLFLQWISILEILTLFKRDGLLTIMGFVQEFAGK
jgi:hypothetical protein